MRIGLKCFFYGLILYGGGFFVFIFSAHYLTDFGFTLEPIHHPDKHLGLLYKDVILAIIVGLIASAVLLRRNRLKSDSE